MENETKNKLDNQQVEIDILKIDQWVQWCLAKIQDLRDEFQFYGFHTVEELDHMETPQGKQEIKEKRIKNLNGNKLN